LAVLRGDRGCGATIDDAADLTAGASILDQMRRPPTLTMQVFVAQGGSQVLDQMLQRAAVAEFARTFGMRVKRPVEASCARSRVSCGPTAASTKASGPPSHARLEEALVRRVRLARAPADHPIAFSPMPESSGSATPAAGERARAIALLPSGTSPTAAPTDAAADVLRQTSSLRARARHPLRQLR
jgi:hypothetical protein